MLARLERGTDRVRRAPIVVMVLGALTLALSLWPGSAALLALGRGSLFELQVWRVFSCHFVHWSRAHAAWDLLAFVVLGAICERTDRRRLVLCLGSAAVAIAAVVVVARPRLEAYAGLSGLDMALFGLALAHLCRERLAGRGPAGRALIVLATGALFAKLAYELTSGATLLFQPEAAGFVPIPEAHLVGALVGLGWGYRDAARRASNLPWREPSGHPLPPSFPSPTAAYWRD